MEPALAIFMTLLGHCWQAQLTPTDLDTHCFSDVWNGSHVRDRHVVTQNGKAVYEGETIYSFDGRTIVFTYYNSLGGVGTGTAESKDHKVRFTGSMSARPGSKPQVIDSSWRIREDSYEVVNAGSKATIRFTQAR